MKPPMNENKFIAAALLALVILVCLLIWVLTTPANPKPGVREYPSNEMVLHYDYKLDVACYSWGVAMSCVRIPQDGGK